MPKIRKKTRKKRRNRDSEDKPLDQKNQSPAKVENPQSYEEILEYLNEDISIVETTFGEIPFSNDMFLLHMKQKELLLELLDREDYTEDVLDLFVIYKKLSDKYPGEPYLESSIAYCYSKLERETEYRQKVIENFKHYQGYPEIDLAYVRLQNTVNNSNNYFGILFGEQLNIATIYPTFKAFSENTITEFYTEAALYYGRLKAYDRAKECAAVIGIFDHSQEKALNTAIDFIGNPRKRFFGGLLTIFIVLLILAIIIGIIWGVIKFFQWIF